VSQWERVSRYVIEPEVAGRLGGRTVLDTSVQPSVVSHLHYVIDGWLGSQRLESFQCFIASDSFVAAIRDAALTGFTIADAEVELSIIQPMLTDAVIEPIGTS